MSVAPDTAGFRDAQRRLRELLGVTVGFLIPVAGVYPPDTPTGADGKPLDPWADADEDPRHDRVELTCLLVNKPITGSQVKDHADNTPIGFVAYNHVALSLDPDEAPAVEAATHFEVLDGRYRITTRGLDELATSQRFLVWGQKT